MVQLNIHAATHGEGYKINAKRSGDKRDVVTFAEHPVVAVFEKFTNNPSCFCNVQVISLGCLRKLSPTGMATNGMERPCEWLWRKLALFTA